MKKGGFEQVTNKRDTKQNQKKKPGRPRKNIPAALAES